MSVSAGYQGEIFQSSTFVREESHSKSVTIVHEPNSGRLIMWQWIVKFDFEGIPVTIPTKFHDSTKDYTPPPPIPGSSS